MKRHLQCAEQQKAASNFSKYCACHAKWISWLIHITYETAFTMRRATGITFQLHQILRLPRKMNLRIDPHHIWNVIYNARSNSQHPPTSPNTAPATQNASHDWCTSHMKRHFQCAEREESPSNLTKYCACHAKGVSRLIRITYERSFTMRGATGINFQPHQILRLPRKRNLMIDPHHIWNVTYNARSNRHHPPTSPNTAPATQNESHDWSASHMKRHLQCAEQQASPSNLTKYCACHAKWISWLMHRTYETSFTMRGATVKTLQPHQILRLPRKLNLMIDADHIWNVIYNARSNSPHPPTSPNTAPATQNESHDWCTSHLKRHLQCAEQQASTSNLTKYCACHAKWAHNIWQKFAENRCNVISNARPIRDRSEHIRPWSDPENANRNPPRRQGYFSHSPGADSIENYNVSRSGYHSKFHHMLRLPQKVTQELHQMLHLARKVTHELHQILRLPRKLNLMIDAHHIWNVVCNARSNSQHPPTSPNTAPATQNESHDWCTSHLKRHLQCAEQQASTSNLTKYCACHAKSAHNIWQKFAENRCNVISNARPIRDRSETVPSISDHDPTQKTQTATRRAAKATFRTRQEQIPLKITTFPAPAIIPNFTTCCACHKKWHMNFTKCCACHEKWHEVTHDYYY